MTIKSTSGVVPMVTRSVHMPLEVYEKIKEKADNQQRSFTWMAVHLLTTALEQEGNVKQAQTSEHK